MAQSPVFLERRGYRLRRMMDAVRFLPLLGLALWMVPLLWPLSDAAAQGSPEPIRMSTALRYIFGIWGGLVLIVWALWRWTKDQTGKDDVPDAGAD